MISDFNYIFENCQIEKVIEHKDLGVIFENNLSFNKHITQISNNAYRSLGCVKRFAKGFTLNSKKTLFCSLVRSQIEYASQIWSPYTSNQIDMIERIQKNFTIWALDIARDPSTFRYPSYDLRIEALNLKKLTRRRTEAAIFLMYELLTRNMDAQIIYNNIRFNQSQRQSRNRELLKIDTFSTNFAMMQPIVRLSRVFNKISYVMFEENNKNTFKRKILSLNDEIIGIY